MLCVCVCVCERERERGREGGSIRMNNSWFMCSHCGYSTMSAVVPMLASLTRIHCFLGIFVACRLGTVHLVIPPSLPGAS